MELRLISESNEGNGSSISVSDSLFNRDYNEALVHQVITTYLSNARKANSAQKGRSDIAKSNHKPWRQKGTGRARAGRASSPIWRGGGKTFPNTTEENYTKKLNKKMYRAGMSVILSQLVRDDRLVAINEFQIDTPRTKEMSSKLTGMDLKDVLIVTHDLNDNLYLSSRNIPFVSIIDVKNVDPVSLLRFEKTIVTTEGIKKLEGLLA